MTIDITNDDQCSNCGALEYLTLFNTCDKMDLPDHQKCNDECRPREQSETAACEVAKKYDMRLSDLDQLFRCAGCGNHVD